MLTHRHNELKNIQKQLDVDILSTINTPGGKAEVIIHIDQVLEECKKYDFLTLLNLGSSRSRG